MLIGYTENQTPEAVCIKENLHGNTYSCEVILLQLLNSWKVEAENIFCYGWECGTALQGMSAHITH